VIDTAPHSSDATALAIRASDLVLIPVRPSIFDLRAIGTTVELAQQASKHAVAVLNAVAPRGSLVDEAREAIGQYGIDVAPVTLGQRQAFTNAITAGLTAQEYEPTGKAAQEADALYKWIITQVGL
jgi:chromosome partitioning protein